MKIKTEQKQFGMKTVRGGGGGEHTLLSSLALPAGASLAAMATYREGGSV